MAQEIPESFGVGLVIGKFDPLTRGHQYLIETAIGRCRKVIVSLSNGFIETIPAAQRRQWLNELYPGVEVVVMDRSLPNHPSEVNGDLDRFYNGHWVPALRRACRGTPDAIFSSEAYGDEVARYMPPMRHVLVDRERRAVPISATQVRCNPLGCWDYLHPLVRSYFVRMVCLYGPESTGKTTLCQKLAEHYGTLWQPEWARGFLDGVNRHCTYEDMELFARQQYEQREDYRRRANKVLFVDTDTLTTRCYSEQYYGKYPACIDEIVARPDNQFDLYLFTQVDVPWVAEAGRDFGTPELRRAMQHRFGRLLEERHLPYVTIEGDWDQRFQRACEAVDGMLSRPFAPFLAPPAPNP
jgi:NadR type nicotinamide-nucleotide adenylyltransferase